MFSDLTGGAFYQTNVDNLYPKKGFTNRVAEKYMYYYIFYLQLPATERRGKKPK
jgi:hypothetical protein